MPPFRSKKIADYYLLPDASNFVKNKIGHSSSSRLYRSLENIPNTFYFFNFSHSTVSVVDSNNKFVKFKRKSLCKFKVQKARR